MDCHLQLFGGVIWPGKIYPRIWSVGWMDWSHTATANGTMTFVQLSTKINRWQPCCASKWWPFSCGADQSEVGCDRYVYAKNNFLFWETCDGWNVISCCLARYYCIVYNRVMVAFINRSLYSCEMHRQVKEMDNLHLFIEHHYKYIVSIIRVKHILTLHLSTANCRIKPHYWLLLQECGCTLCNHFLPGRVNTTVPRVVAYANVCSRNI